MNITSRINAEMANLSNSVKIGADNYKLDCRIAQQQKRIKEMIHEIGTLALIKLDDGEEMCPEIMERYQAIEEARNAIAELKSGKKSTKAVCPECGMKTSTDMNYCGRCGEKLLVEEVKEETAEEVKAELI